MTTLYLSSQIMQAAAGDGGAHPAIAKCTAQVDISGCMFGGGVSDPERLSALVRQLFAENGLSPKNVRLVLGTTQVVTRVMRVPAQSDGKMTEFIRNEFSNVARTQQPVFSYSVLTTEKKTGISVVLASLVDQPVLCGYRELLAKCGVTISSAVPALPCAIRALRGSLGSMTCVVQLMEDTGFASLLFSGGIYRYSTLDRLASAHGTPELGSEIARSVSSISQFAKAQQVAQPVTEVLFAGFSKEDGEIAAEAVRRMGGGIEAGPLPPSRLFSAHGLPVADCVFAGGGLLPVGKTEDLLLRMNRRQSAAKPLGGFAWAAAGLLLLLCLLITATITVSKIRSDKKAELQQLNAYNASASVQDGVAYDGALLSELTKLTQKIGNVGAVRTLLDSYPIPNARVNRELQTCANGLAAAEILEYSSKTGELKLSVQAEEVDRIHQFIEKLGDDAMFEIEDYSGYEYVPSKNLWSVNVVVILSAQAGREG